MTSPGTLVNPFSNGYWIWDEFRGSLWFVSRDTGLRAVSTMQEAALSTVIAGPKRNYKNFQISFRDITDKLEKLIFKRYFQRRVKLGQPDVITIQDVKDIALYLANAEDLTVEFIRFFHTATVDRFLRALVLYLQYFLDIWDSILEGRADTERKLRQPIVTELENTIRDDLADLRVLLAKEYLALICGLRDCEQYHHMKHCTSLSERDRRLFEMLLSMAVRVVWITLQRRHLHLIELEMNRVFRSDSFNLVTHRRNVHAAKRSAAEDRVLIGEANRFERTLLQRSPLVKELLFADHDHRMLGAGVKVFQPRDARIDYIEAACSAPEEELNKMGIAVGLLGIPREEFDPVLIARERTSKTYTKPPTILPEFRLPPKKYHSYTELPNTFPKEPCHYRETAQTIKCRKTQCKMWANHVGTIQLGTAETSSDKVRRESSASRLSLNDKP